jgi:hypothetical protein
MADQQPPTQQTPPQQPPQWTPPPQQPPAWGAPPPGQWGGQGGGVRPPRPMSVTFAGIWLILAGLLWLLAGGACAFGGTQSSGWLQTAGLPQDVSDALGGILFGAGIAGLVLAILQLLAGVGSFGGRGWARWIGILVSVILVLPFVLFVLTSLGGLGQDGVLQFLVFSLIFLVGYSFVVYAFARANAFFSYRS